MLRIVFTGVCGMVQLYGKTHMLMHSVIPLQNNTYKLPFMYLFNCVRTFLSYSQLSWIMHFLQNLLSQSVVKLTLLPIGTS
jgi:hypothetical protein